MRYIFFFGVFLFFIVSCKSKYLVTEQYVYNNNGFTEGVTIQMLKVEEFNKEGVPKKYQYDSVRVDLNYSSQAAVKKKLWLHKENIGYYWTQQLKGEYKTMPIDFEKGRWYILWSNVFKSGFFRTNQHHFFIFKNNLGRLVIKEEVWQTNM